MIRMMNFWGRSACPANLLASRCDFLWRSWVIFGQHTKHPQRDLTVCESQIAPWQGTPARCGITQMPTFGGLRIALKCLAAANREVAETRFGDLAENLA